MKITVCANDEKITISCPPRKIGNLYKRILQGLKAYDIEIDEKSDAALIDFLKIKYFQKNGFSCREQEEIGFGINLYKDFNIKEGWTIYRGIKIMRAKQSQIFKIGKTTNVEKYFEDCFETIDREINN